MMVINCRLYNRMSFLVLRTADGLFGDETGVLLDLGAGDHTVAVGVKAGPDLGRPGGAAPIDSRLSGYFPFQDAVGHWTRLQPPGPRPSARDTPLGLSLPLLLPVVTLLALTALALMDRGEGTRTLAASARTVAALPASEMPTSCSHTPHHRLAHR